MRSLLCLFVGICLSPAFADDLPTLGKIVVLDPALEDAVDLDAPIEVLSMGHEWTEGPVWVPAGGLGQNADDGGFVLYSDIPRNSIYRWSSKAAPAQAVSVFLKPSGYTGFEPYSDEPGCNGLMLDAKGQLTLCEHGDRRISRVTAKGGKITLADRYQGKRLNSPNDLCFDKHGNIYFTDPIYGLPGRENSDLRELDFCGVYRIDADGKLNLLTKEMTRPNGIGISPDGKTLIVAQSDPAAALWKTFPIEPDGELGPSKLFFDATSEREGKKGLPDGLDIDVEGRVWATGPGGVWVFTASGKPLGRIDTGEATANCTFGGEDGSTLFLAADHYLCRIQTKTRGHRVFAK